MKDRLDIINWKNKKTANWLLFQLVKPKFHVDIKFGYSPATIIYYPKPYDKSPCEYYRRHGLELDIQIIFLRLMIYFYPIKENGPTQNLFNPGK